MADPALRDDSNARDTDRLETFSDGVIAIAITLLIIEIHVPEIGDAGNRELLDQLLHLWPSYLGYAVSFLTIGIMWINHHLIFRFIRRTDQKLVVINTLFLLCVAFIPFPTGVMARYLGEPAERTAVVFYGGTFTLTAVFYYLLWSYPTRGRRLLEPDADQAAIDAIERRFRVGWPIYLAGTIVALILPLLGMFVFLALALYYVLPYLVSTSPPGADAS
jgi:uncharacterized membrane protein